VDESDSYSQDKTAIVIVACILGTLFVLPLAGIGTFILLGQEGPSRIALANNSKENLLLIVDGHSATLFPGARSEFGFSSTRAFAVRTTDGHEFRYIMPPMDGHVAYRGKIYLQIEPDRMVRVRASSQPEGFPLSPE
jgi:hypothetical protein